LTLPAAAAGQSLAPSPDRPPTAYALAPGEILLKVKGKGMQRSTPDVATIVVAIATTGVDAAAARASDQTVIDKLKADMRSLGIDQTAITMLSVATVQAMGDPDLIEVPPSRDAKQPPRYYANSALQLRLDMAKLARLRTLLQDRKELRLMPAVYALLDDSSARRAAIDQALAKARIDAAIYAKAMNMRVDRVIGIADSPDMFDLKESFARMTGAGLMPDAVQTKATLELDVILKPL
jgi:uncharacterized protein YggE